MHFPQILINIMEEKQMTTYRLSKETGISDSLLGSYRSGRSDPSSANLVKIADALQVSVDYLLGRTGNPEVNR